MQVTPGWLYYVKDGKLITEFGEAHTSYRKNGMFEVNRNRRVCIDGAPWTVRNNFIWCPNVERDDIRAVKLFIEYEDKMIEDLQSKYYKHNDRYRVANDILKRLQNNKEESED